MPELPEVETVKNGLQTFLCGRVIEKAVLHREGLRVPFPEGLARRLKGRTVKSLSRRAKYILIDIGGQDVMALHLGMSGRITVHHDMNGYRPEKHDHMILFLSGGGGVAFNDPRRFGMVYLIKRDELERHPAFAALGPEPLSNDFSGPVLKARLARRKTPVKVALLDQRVVAGIGNIYASEALFQAGIHPAKPSSSLTARQVEDLVKAIRDVLQRAIAAGGSSLKDFRRSDGSLGYFQHSFSVYGRDGQACPACGDGDKTKSTVHKIIQAGRATYFCPSCQKK